MAVRVQLRLGCGEGNVEPMLDPGGPSLVGGIVFEAPGCVCVYAERYDIFGARLSLEESAAGLFPFSINFLLRR